MHRLILASTAAVSVLVCVGALTQARAAVVSGTNQTDRLVGTRFNDNIRALRGNDVVLARPRAGRSR
jgi:hypothetical protein